MLRNYASRAEFRAPETRRFSKGRLRRYTAMGLKKPVVVSGKKDAFFFQLPNVHCVDTDEAIIAKVQELA